MRCLILIPIFTLLLLTHTFGQEDNTFRVRIGSKGSNQECNSAIIGNDGFIYVAGIDDNNSWGKTRFFLVKVNQEGDTLWTKNWGTANVPDYLKSVIETNDNHLVVLGKKKSGMPNNPSYDLYVSKNAKENGEIIWFQEYGGTEDEIPESIIQSTDNGFIILATVRALTGNQSILIKIDSQGHRLWTKSLNQLGNVKGSKLLPLKENEFAYIGTISQFEGGDTDIIFIKFDKNGEQVLKQTYGDKFNEQPLDIFPTKDNNFIISGKVSSLDPYDFSYNAFFLKIDTKGEQLWYQLWNDIEGNSVIQTTDGNLAVGCSYKLKGNYSALVMKLSINDGSLIWSKLIGQDKWDSNITKIIELPDKSLVLIGDTRIDYYYILMCRINSDGTWNIDTE